MILCGNKWETLPGKPMDGGEHAVGQNRGVCVGRGVIIFEDGRH